LDNALEQRAWGKEGRSRMAKVPLKDDDYLKLWMYFEDRADKIKEEMFKTLTWTVGFAAALLGFIFHNLTSHDTAKATAPLSLAIIIPAAAGLVICLYSWFMLSESAKHVKGNWERAKSFEENVEDLGKLIHGSSRKTDKTMKIWHRLQIIVVLFAIGFAALLSWTIAAA
jgi:hypothetical protein